MFRRDLLRAGVAVSAAVVTAGCSSGPGATGTSTGTQTDSGPVASVTVQATTLVVRLGTPEAVDRVALIGPDGRSVATQQVTAGQRTVAFRTAVVDDTQFKTLPAGDYRVVAADSEGTIQDERTVTLSRELEIVGLSTVSTRPPNDFTEEKPPIGGPLRATVRNVGTLPLKLTYFGAPTGVLARSPPPREVTGDHIEPVGQSEDPHPLVVAPTQTVRVRTPDRPLYYYDARGELNDSQAATLRSACQGTTRKATVVIKTTSGGAMKAAATIKYDGNAVEWQTLDIDYGCTNTTVISWSKQ